MSWTQILQHLPPSYPPPSLPSLPQLPRAATKRGPVGPARPRGQALGARGPEVSRLPGWPRRALSGSSLARWWASSA